MADFEGLGVFYLGREYDPASATRSDVPVLYDSKDLVTHALIVGMTGSGKTGLGIALIEEAALDGVPVIVIDPKGDLSNLLLTFPQLRASDFEPWINPDDAARTGKPASAFAAGEAERWKQGLAAWQQDGSRITRLREAADVAIYTPGSSIAMPVSVLSTLAPPPNDDTETFQEQVHITASSLLALAAIEADPIKSREHMLLSAVLTAAWQAGETLDLGALVQRVQQPPMTRVGVIDVDSFFPPKDRFAFAMSLNALLASPSFALWTKGVPLDIAAFLRSAAGKPRVSIFSIAHLDDAQRMFFVSLLLTAVAGWMRRQSGTSSLRAIVYMDEIFGFFPPVSNPPSKPPLLTLLKQGRAAGLGVVLATQNPVDLDYKGLSNIGTWWLGRLQTDRDKQRVLDGLEGAGATAAFDRGGLDRLLSSLKPRVFLMRNVHDAGLTVFESRWALSYLRGPLGREEIKRLHAASSTSAQSAPEVAPATRPASGTIAATAGATPLSAAEQPPVSRPVMPPGVPQFFAPQASAARRLRPVVYGAAEVRYVDRKLKLDDIQTVHLAAPIADGPVPLDWRDADEVAITPDSLEAAPPASGNVQYEPVPAPASRPANYTAWGRELAAHLSANRPIEILVSTATGDASRPGESERDFRARLQHATRESRDRAVDALRKRYAPKAAALDERLRRAKQAVERENEQASGQRMQTAISMGATLLGALLGKKGSLGGVGRATTAARGIGRSMKESKDIARAQETVAAIEAQRAELEEQLAAETAAIQAQTDAGQTALEKVLVNPKKTQVTVKLIALVWTP
jgi:hypothetical protein